MKIRVVLLTMVLLSGLASMAHSEDAKELILTPEQLKEYANSYKLPEVLHLRQFLNTYADSRNKVDGGEEAAAKRLDKRTIDRKILKGRFIVYWIDGALGGGKIITIVSQKHPEVMLSFWVYNVTDKTCRVNDLLDKRDDRDLESFKRVFRRFLADEQLSM